MVSHSASQADPERGTFHKNPVISEAILAAEINFFAPPQKNICFRLVPSSPPSCTRASLGLRLGGGGASRDCDVTRSSAHAQYEFRYPWLSIVKTFIMMLGEMEFAAIFLGLEGMEDAPIEETHMHQVGPPPAPPPPNPLLPGRRPGLRGYSLTRMRKTRVQFSCSRCETHQTAFCVCRTQGVKNVSLMCPKCVHQSA